MTTTVKNIKLSPIKQLFDLNGELTNFDLYFEISTKNVPFDVLVVTQKILDTNNDLQYRNVANGFINGNIVSDKGVYDNYFLLIKSNQECDCQIKITIKEIPVNQDFLKEQQNRMLEERKKNFELENKGQQLEKPVDPQNKLNKLNSKLNKLTDKNTQDTKTSSQNSGFFTWKFVLIAIILVAGGIVLWKIYNSNKNKASLNTQNNIKTSYPNIQQQYIQPNIQPNNQQNILTPVLQQEHNQFFNQPLPQINVNNIPEIKISNENIPVNTNETNLLNKINNIPIW